MPISKFIRSAPVSVLGTKIMIVVGWAQPTDWIPGRLESQSTKLALTGIGMATNRSPQIGTESRDLGNMVFSRLKL